MSFIYHQYLIFTTKVVAKSLHPFIWFSLWFYCLTGFFIVFRFFCLALGFNFIVILWTLFNLFQNGSTLVKYILPNVWTSAFKENIPLYLSSLTVETSVYGMGEFGHDRVPISLSEERESSEQTNLEPQWKCSIMLSHRYRLHMPLSFYTCFKEIEKTLVCTTLLSLFLSLFSLSGRQILSLMSDQVPRALLY